jgi:hypothetical protein
MIQNTLIGGLVVVALLFGLLYIHDPGLARDVVFMIACELTPGKTCLVCCH